MFFSGYLRGKETSSRSAVFIAQLKNMFQRDFTVLKYCLWDIKFE